MNNVLVIGNGFDLAFGFLTSYMSFAEKGVAVAVPALNGMEFWPFNEAADEKYQHSLYQHFHEHKILNQDNLGRVRWIDVEGELWKYAKSKKGERLSPEFISQDKNTFHLLKDRLKIYIERMHPHEWAKDNEDPNIRPFLKVLKENGDFKKIYTFNYTDVQLVLQKFVGYTEDDLPEVVYIHGSTKEKNIVLGIHDEPSIPNEYAFLRKSSQTKLYDLSTDLLQADEIIIYGLSIDKIDGQYFESFFHQMASTSAVCMEATSKKRLTILTKGKSSVKSIKKNITDMGFCPDTFNERLEMCIIDMGDLYLGTQSKDDYEQLITRLKKGDNGWTSLNQR